MNKISHHQTPAAVRDTETTVAIHFALPPSPDLDSEICFNNALAFLFTTRGLLGALRRAGLLSDGESFGSEGILAEGLIMFSTPRRNEAIQLAREFLADLSLRESTAFNFIHLAYKTADEVWFPVEPSAPNVPFEHWLGGQPKADRAEIMNDREANARQFILATAARIS